MGDIQLSDGTLLNIPDEISENVSKRALNVFVDELNRHHSQVAVELFKEREAESKSKTLKADFEGRKCDYCEKSHPDELFAPDQDNGETDTCVWCLVDLLKETVGSKCQYLYSKQQRLDEAEKRVSTFLSMFDGEGGYEINMEVDENNVMTLSMDYDKWNEALSKLQDTSGGDV